MYAIAIIRYRKPIEDVLAVLDEHRAYLRTLLDAGTLLVSGLRFGGALLLRVPDSDDALAALDRVRDGDPYVRAGVAQYELLPRAPNTGAEKLERL